MLTDAQVRAFERDGFLAGGALLTAAEVAELTTELDRVLATGPEGFAAGEPQPVLFRDLNAGRGDDDGDGGTSGNPVWQIVNMWQVSTAFRRLIFHPAVVTGISQLTGFADLQVWHDQLQYKPAATGGATGWHQDAPAWPVIEPMTPVSAWIPLDDADEGNGCMWMVPGSHHWGDRSAYLRTLQDLRTRAEFARVGADFTPPADAEIQQVQAVPRPVRRGEVHFHHSLTWHGSPENTSARSRRAIAIHYMTSAARYSARAAREGRSHPMQQFIAVAPGEPMLGAGPHFPVVCRGGRPLAAAAANPLGGND